VSAERCRDIVSTNLRLGTTHKEHVATFRRLGTCSIIRANLDRAYLGIFIGTEAAMMARYENKFKTKLPDFIEHDRPIVG
jgi:hypothetical protein